MKNWKKVLLAVIPATLAFSFTSMAGQWHQDMNGWWYENDDGSYLRNGWYWVDGNEDGIAESYYFGNGGYVVDRQKQVEGYDINEDGAWVVDGVVQTMEVAKPNDSTAMAAYKAAQAKNAELDSIDADVNAYMSMDADGQVVDMSMDVSMKMKGVKSGNMEFIMEGNMDMLGTEMPFSTFYTDGYMYTDVLGMKVKQAMPIYDAMETATGTMNMVEVDESMLTDMQMRMDGEDTVITYSLDAGKITSFVNEMMGMEAFNELADSGFKVSYDITRADGEAVIDKNGYYTREVVYLNMNMTMTETETGETAAMGYEVDMEMNVNNPGQPVEFKLPSKEGYTESTALLN